ncbi:MAG: sensor domain-containing diguanylate cyclase [Cyanophyceae cyanobacterium]
MTPERPLPSAVPAAVSCPHADPLSPSQTPPPLRPFTSFEEAAQVTLSLLHARLGFQLWMVARTEGEDWIVLQAHDHGYGIQGGQSLPWDDSFCSRMVAGLGPQVAPSVEEVEVYCNAPIAQRLAIGAYIGVPIHRADGSFFGTLCAIDPLPQPPEIQRELEFVYLMARLLVTFLEQELTAQTLAREYDRAQLESQTDAMTGLYNRRGWLQLLAAEEERCRRYGNMAAAIYVDLDNLKDVNDREGHGAGDRLIQWAAQQLMATLRQTDVIARLGGDEFAVLCVETDLMAVRQLVERLEATFEHHGIGASIGYAVRLPPESLAETLHRADSAMYIRKQYRKGLLRS